MSEWISVKDRLPEGVACLAFYKNNLGRNRIVKAKYTKKYTEEASYDDEWLEYNEYYDTFYYPEGWYEMIDNWDDFSSVKINHDVTHWMPLPPPPTEE